MYYTIYKITNKINGKIYIGQHQTKNLDDGYMGSGKRIIRSINKHGIENFDKEILHIFETQEEMNAKEAELVTEEFCLREDTYNLSIGGCAGWNYVNTSGIIKFKGKRHTENSKKKMGHPGNKNWLGRQHLDESKKKIGLNTTLKLSGKPRSEETKKKISITRKEQASWNLIFLAQIIEYARENDLSIRKTCKMFGLNRITYTKYLKEILLCL